jgi:hypothetical protein
VYAAQFSPVRIKNRKYASITLQYRFAREILWDPFHLVKIVSFLTFAGEIFKEI